MDALRFADWLPAGGSRHQRVRWHAFGHRGTGQAYTQGRLLHPIQPLHCVSPCLAVQARASEVLFGCHACDCALSLHCAAAVHWLCQ